MPHTPDNSIASVGEFVLIDRLRRLVPTTGPGVVLGIGDDAAVLQFSHPVVATCDSQVEGVHFTWALCPPADVGWRALAVNLSDVAGMGGTPRHALISLVLPSDAALAMVEDLYRGIADAARAHAVSIVGGNVSATDGPLVIDVALLGEAPHAVTRSGARPGDGVWVTGSLGKAAAGRFLLQHPEIQVPQRAALERAYRRPSPRVGAGRVLSTLGPDAMIDTSDGTASDLLHLVEASGVGVRLDEERLPLADGLGPVAQAAGIDPRAWALGGGEDYELLFTAGPAFDAEAPRIARQIAVTLTRIGEILPAPAGRWIQGPDGHPRPLAAQGWDHFQAGR
ncbi:MAG TPA: thiamine-phosphate kinase [bacterium]|nr:thiamine-phosphate kinase [bacterium]